MAKQLRCETIHGTMSLTGMSPMRQCPKAAVAKESWTTPNGIAKTKLACKAHRTVMSDTITKTFKSEEL